MTHAIDILEKSDRIVQAAIKRHKPDYIVSMVSGGKDSAASHAVLEDLGVKIDFIIHGQTRTGIPETTEFVKDYYGRKTPELLIADAGTAYEDYILRKGFFGCGYDAHAYAYRILKAGPFRKLISATMRKRQRGINILLFNGARKDESENRQKNLKLFRRDPASKGNIWFNPIHWWDQESRDQYLEKRQVPINPVAKALCRSGECMCGTMQSKAERIEAAAIYPEWGGYMDNLEAEVRKKFPWGWGEVMPKWYKQHKDGQRDLFMPMCVGCGKDGGNAT